MKKRCFALLLVLCLALGLAPAPALAAEAISYDDVRAGDWFYESVVYVTERGLMMGTGEGRFQPELACDRAMLVTVLHRGEHSPQVSGVSFTDVPEDAYYASAVAWARLSGIVKGYGDGRFGPNDPLTREQMLVILYRYAEYKGFDVSARAALEDFSDGAQTAEYARSAMEWGVASGLVTGVGAGLLDPQGVVTRAQLAALLARFEGLTDAQEVSAGRAALRDFTANQTALAAGTDAAVTFTVYTSRPAAEIFLCRDDGVTLGTMRDDGQGGDSVAGDGVYTFVWAIRDVPAGTYACYAALGSSESRRVEISLAAGGLITGLVCRAAGRAALPGALLEVYRDGLLSATVTTDASGAYSLYLPAGDYVVVITREGFVPARAYVTVTSGGETYSETCLLVEGTPGEMGSASGMVISAVTGKGMADVLLEVRAGWNNTTAGDVVAAVTTDADGRYELTLPLGSYTVLASKEGCIPASFNIVATLDGTGNQNGSITPVAGDNVYRLVLTWGERPGDLDSHVVGTDSEGRPFHVSIVTGGLPGPGGTYICVLDVDDTNGYGPETVSLDPQEDRTYYYYVQQYSEDGAMSTSGASVQVYRGDALLAACNVPTNQGDGMYWNVLAVKNGALILKNTVTTKPDTAYAN